MKTRNPTNQPLLFDPPYHSVAPERCALQHDWRLVSYTPDVNRWGKRYPEAKGRNYEYGCNLCNVEHLFQAEKLERKPNPLCFEEKHYWLPACYDGCCPWEFCYCGATKMIVPNQSSGRAPKFTHDFDGNLIVKAGAVQ